MSLFTTTAFSLSSLVEQIDRGQIGLPELQRPFVWPNTNVRNLFDSLYRGYPAGYLLLWETGAEADTKTIGKAEHAKAPGLVIVDGQQRLTSLYAVTRGKEVLRSNFKHERIRIAFNPLEERFDVLDASIVKDKAYIPDISVLWRPETNLIPFAMAYTSELAAVRDLTPEEINKAQEAIGRLHNLLSYTFTALTLSATVDPEVVAEVFVRINGEGKKLNQADFIMTLMSVHWDEGRAELERFAGEAMRPGSEKSGYNHFIKPTPDQLLRVGVGLGLKRARLQNVYSVLRGRDAATGEIDPTKRDAQFALLRQAQTKALDLANWHHFLGALNLAGYRHEGMITSKTAVIYSYVLYLIGLIDHGVDRQTMRQVIAEFFFMASLTGRYTSSPETAFEFDIAQLRDAHDGEAFLAHLRRVCDTALTSDFFTIQLPSHLATSASVSPSKSAYLAALIKLGASVLYSPLALSDLVDPVVRGTRAAVEQHHLFPRAYLAREGVTDQRQYNQIANFAFVEWPDNLAIADKAPADYAPELDAALSPQDRERAQFHHALAPEWWTMPYADFLIDRRVRMARVIQQAWEVLRGASPATEAPAVSVAALIAQGESGGVEFKSTLRVNLHTGQDDDRIRVSALKTIAGFLNARGGVLIIGVADDGEVLGLDADRFDSEDKMVLHLVDLIRQRIGELYLPYIHPRFEEQDGRRVLVVQCERGPKAAFVKDGPQQRFYVRGANSTAELGGASIPDYIKARFG